MSYRTGIGWTDSTWPIVQGCDPVSPGCEHCYVPKELIRLAGNPNAKISGPIQGLAERHTNVAGTTKLRFTGKVALREDRLDWPLHWRTPRKIFVPSHGDIFHEDVPDAFLDKIFARMGFTAEHTYQVLTKRAARQLAYIADPQTPERIDAVMRKMATEHQWCTCELEDWPLKNVWQGVSAERQQEADERIPVLLQTPAAVRFVSLEPLLGPIDLSTIRYRDGDADIRIDALTAEAWVENSDSASAYTNAADGNPRLDWVIVGGESGKEARPMHPDWARALRDQCAAAGVAFFFKQWGEWTGETNLPAEWPWTEHVFDDGVVVARVGKKRAGQLLDGVEHNGFPAIAEAA